MNINANTGIGWTDAEEATFAQIMRIGRMERIKAIQLFRRCNSDHAKAVKLARDNHGLSDLQIAAYERSKGARFSGLVKARQKLTQDRPIELLELHA